MEVDKHNKPSLVEVCMADLFSTDEELAAKGYTPVVVKQLLPIREQLCKRAQTRKLACRLCRMQPRQALGRCICGLT